MIFETKFNFLSITNYCPTKQQQQTDRVNVNLLLFVVIFLQ